MAIPCLLFEYEQKILNRENVSEERTSVERTSVETASVETASVETASVETASVERPHGKRTIWEHTRQAHSPGAHITEDMDRDFQLNAFKFTGHRITLTGDSIEDAILQACCVLKSSHPQKETFGDYNEVTLKDGNTELSAESHDHPLPSWGASAVQEQAEIQETHMDSNPAVPMKTQEERVSVKSPMEAIVESTKVEEGPKYDSKVMNDTKGNNKLRNEEKENENHLELQDTAVQSFSLEELGAKASAVLESAPPAKTSQATAAQDKAAQGRAEQVCFGTFEEDFFNSYVPPSQPLTEEELLEMKEGVSPKLRFKGSHRTNSKRGHKNQRRGFMSWLTAVFFS